MKRSVSLIFALLMILSAAVYAVPAEAADSGLAFDDVRTTDWFYPTVKAICDEGVMEGKSDAVFDPLASVKRSELVTILSRVACADTEGCGEALAFSDTKPGAWYAPFVGWAVGAGLVNGYPDGTFRPGSPVKRQELAAIVVRFVSFMEAEVRAADPVDGFSDGEKIPAWAREYVEELRKTGLVRGDSKGNFNPSSTATRAETATVITRLLPFTSRLTVAKDGKCDFVIAGDLSSEGVVSAAERLNWQLGRVCGAGPLETVEDDGQTGGRIVLRTGVGGLGADGFAIGVEDGGVTVSAETDAGLYRGVVRLVNDHAKGGVLRVSGKSGGRPAAGSPVGSVSVKGHDISEYTIFYPAGMTADAEESVRDLARYIKLACGADVPLKEGAPEGLSIIIDRSVRDDPESFTIKTEGDNIRIRGCDHAAEDLGIPKNDSLGISFGIYSFLEKQLGVRFLTEDEDYVIPAEKIEIGDLDIADAPAIRHRIIYWTDYLGSRRLCLRNGVADGLVWANGIACHSFDALDGDFSDQYSNQPCLTDETVYERVLGNVLSWLDNNPNCTYISVSQNDNNNYCRCENCLRVIEEEESEAGPVIRFVNRIAREVAKVRPDVRIHTFAYAYSVDPPKITKPEPNVSVQLCSIDQCFAHPLSGVNACKTNESFTERITRWAEISEELMIWDYTNNFAFRSCPFPNLTYDVLAGNMRLFAENKAQYIFAQGNGRAGENGEFDHVRSYLLAKLAWDPYMSEDEYYAYMREYMQGFYGEGWESLYNALILMHTYRTLNCLEVFDTPSTVCYQLRPIAPRLIDAYKTAMEKAETEKQFIRADQTGIQFDYAWVEANFSRMYKSSDPAERQAILDASFALQAKMQKYRAKFSDAYPPPELYEITAPPSEWKGLMDEQMGLD